MVESLHQGLTQWIQCKFGKQYLFKKNDNCRQSGLYVDQTQSRREAPLTMQVPKMTVFCFLVSRFLTLTSTGSCSSTIAVSLQSRSPLSPAALPLPCSPAHPPQPQLRQGTTHSTGLCCCQNTQDRSSIFAASHCFLHSPHFQTPASNPSLKPYNTGLPVFKNVTEVYLDNISMVSVNAGFIKAPIFLTG